MIDRLRKKTRSATVVVLFSALVFIVFIGWRILSLGLADFWSVSNPQRALTWRSNHPAALFSLSENLSASGNHDAAALASRKAWQAYPLDGRPLRVMAQAADARGDAVKALHLYEIATQRSPRDLLSLAWLADHNFKQGRPAEALAYLDRIMRIQPEFVPKMVPQLAIVATLPGAQKDLASLLQTQPEWRAEFMLSLPNAIGDIRQLDPFMTTMRRSPQGLTAGELNAWIQRLQRDGRMLEAYALWFGSLSADARTAIGNVVNGDFEREPIGAFDWRFSQTSGAFIALDGSAGNGDTDLHVAFVGRPVVFRGASQWLLLPPGEWELRWAVKADQLKAAQGLAWQISCTDGRVLATTEAIAGSFAWRNSRSTFRVPGSDCPAQELSLILLARYQSERRVSGEAWFDEVGIAPSRGPASH